MTSKNYHNTILRALLAALLLISILGCGGGSSGTGTGGGIVISGLVLDTDNMPIEGATVTVVETGDAGTTDASGMFEIQTDPVSDQLTIQVDTGDTSAELTISVPGDGGILSVTIKVNPLLNQIESQNQLDVQAKIVGLCDIYFENNRVIRQANPVPVGTACTAKVTVWGNGMLLAHAPIAIQYRRCDKGSPWTTTALGATMTGANIGVGQVNFQYFDDEEHCVYRILAPFGLEGVPALSTEIHTFTYQNRKSVG